MENQNNSKPEAPNVYQRIHGVMNDMETVKKKGRNDFHKYDYATEADFVHAIRPLLKKHGLVIIPQLDGEPKYSTPDEKGNVVATIIMKFYIVNIDNQKDQVLAVVPAQGQDKGDKALYKAMTGAKKYFMALTFMVATGDDPEKTDEPTTRRGVPDKSKSGRNSPASQEDEF